MLFKYGRNTTQEGHRCLLVYLSHLSTVRCQTIKRWVPFYQSYIFYSWFLKISVRFSREHKSLHCTFENTGKLGKNKVIWNIDKSSGNAAWTVIDHALRIFVLFCFVLIMRSRISQNHSNFIKRKWLLSTLRIAILRSTHHINLHLYHFLSTNFKSCEEFPEFKRFHFLQIAKWWWWWWWQWYFRKLAHRCIRIVFYSENSNRLN